MYFNESDLIEFLRNKIKCPIKFKKAMDKIAQEKNKFRF